MSPNPLEWYKVNGDLLTAWGERCISGEYPPKGQQHSSLIYIFWHQQKEKKGYM